MRLPSLALMSALALGCGADPRPLVFSPDAVVPPPTTTVTPPPGPFNGDITLTFSSDRPATIFLTTDGSDPTTSKRTRVEGASPLTLTLEATTTVRYFASADGKDEALREDTWVRAGGPKGTISGVVVVGQFAVGHEVGLMRGLSLTRLGTPEAPTELPFFLEGLDSGQHRLTAIADRNDDGALVPFLDYQSEAVTVALDLDDAFKASAEGVRLYLGASGEGLGTLVGVIHLPKPPPLQNLQISVLSPSMLGASMDPTALLQLLQGGYRIFTSQTQSDYPYVVTNLEPGSYVPVPSLIGFGGGGVALNLLADPLRPVQVRADETTTKHFAFGPVTLSGTVTVPGGASTGGLTWGLVAARAVTLADGAQAALMPVLFTTDPATGDLRGSYAGSAFRSGTTVALRAFTSAGQGNPLTEALPWVLNPTSALPAHATVTTGADDVIVDFSAP